MTTSKAIRNLLTASKLSEAGLAEAMGIRKQRITEYLKGERRIVLDRYLEICDKLGVKVSKVLTNK